MLGGESGHADYDSWRRSPTATVTPDALDRVAPGDMLKVVAVLAVHHLRVADKVATVATIPQGTPAPITTT